MRTEVDWLLDESNLDLIKKYNQLFLNLDDMLSVEGSHHEPLFVIGAPRAGTTLVYQGLVQALEVGYVNNVIARFWGNLPLGVHVANNVLEVERQISFTSDHGRTEDPGDVHEFGYFWTRFFKDERHDYAQEVSHNRKKLKNEIIDGSKIFECPILFKNLNCGLRIRALNRLFNSPGFIVVRRNPVKNALSILEARYTFNRNYTDWWSLRPKEILELRTLPPAEQVCQQIEHTYDQIWRDIRKTGVEHVTVEYGEMFKNFESIVDTIADKWDLVQRNHKQFPENPTNRKYDLPDNFVSEVRENVGRTDPEMEVQDST